MAYTHPTPYVSIEKEKTNTLTVPWNQTATAINANAKCSQKQNKMFKLATWSSADSNFAAHSENYRVRSYPLDPAPHPFYLHD